MNDDDADRGHWSLDRRVPLALIAAIAIQTGGAIWFAAKMDQQVEDHDDRIAKLERVSEPLDARLARIEVRLDILLDRLAAADRYQNTDSHNPRNGLP